MPDSNDTGTHGTEPSDDPVEAIDVSTSDLGPADAWPNVLRAAIDSCLRSTVPAIVWWSDQFHGTENEAFRQLMTQDNQPQARDGRADLTSRPLTPAIKRSLELVWSEGIAVVDDGFIASADETDSSDRPGARLVHTPIHDADGQVRGVFTVVIRPDVVDPVRHRSSSSARRRLSDDRAAILQSVTAKLAGAVTTADVGQVVVGEGLSALRADVGVVALRARAEQAVQVVAATGYSDDRIRKWEAFPLDLPSPLSDAAVNGRTVILESRAEAITAYPLLKSILTDAGTEAWVAAPLIVRDRLLGALVFSFNAIQQFHEADRDYIQTLASQCAQAIERAELFDGERDARERAEGIADRIARLQAVTAAMAEAATQEGVAEAALRESIAAVGAAAGGLGVLDQSRQNIRRLAMFGYPTEIVEGTRNVPIDDLGPIADTARTGEAIWLETNEQLFSRYPQLDIIQARRSFGAAISVPLIAGGEVIGVLSLRFQEERPFSGADRDLIYAIARGCAQALERSRLYEAERAARGEAEDAVRARDEFLSIASHELRTPIAALKGATQLILRRQARGDLDDERLIRTLTILNETADRLAGLTDDLLDVSRLRTGHLALSVTPTNLVELVTSVVQRSLDGLDRRHRIVLDAPENCSAITLDPDRVDQVISNVLDNAIKYSPAGGRIEIRVAPEQHGMMVSVRDEGIGLPQSSTETIFEPFGRAENAATSHLPGMGLGLYICRNIIDLHGGWIRAESAGEGHGTTISFWLPESSPEAVP